jgi:hypothetical protein
MTDAMIGIGGRWWKFPGARIDSDSWEGEWRSGGKMRLHDNTGNVFEGVEVDNPEVLAAAPLPTAAESGRRQVALARLLLVAIDLVLSGEGIGLETARDLIREVRHCYPELVDEFIDYERGAPRNPACLPAEHVKKALGLSLMSGKL